MAFPLKDEGVFRVMAINPGSTSTKLGLYDNEKSIFKDTIRHDTKLLAKFSSIPEQKDFRRESIMESLEAAGLDFNSLDAIAGRGGILKPIPSGVYTINERMLEDLHTYTAAFHASVLGALIAKEIGDPLGIPSFIVDPVVVYEMDPITRLSGMPDVERINSFHALNHKAIARHCAAELGKPYDECRFVVAHLGGGITIGAHRDGKVVDVNDGLKGEGPFSPDRCGGVPVMAIIDLCYSGKYTQAELHKKVIGKGGMLDYLGTGEVTEVVKRIEGGDEFAALVLDSMIYQVCKEIGAMAVVLDCELDAVILTGGIAYSSRIVDSIIKRVGKLGPVRVYPGEDELWALTSGVLRVLQGKEKAAEYF